MMKSYILNAATLAGAVSLSSLTACTTPNHNYGQTQLVAARPVVDNTPVVAHPLGELPAAPIDLRPIPSSRPARYVDPLMANSRALRSSTSYPTPTGYTNAVMVYDYEFGQVYKAYAAPLHVTMVLLQPGEKLIKAASGDTVRWLMGDTYTGAGASRRVILMLKPLKADLQTNMIVTTDKRVYLIDAQSGTGAQYQNAIAWNYADDPAELAQATTAADNTAGTDINVANLNFGYRIRVTHGDTPSWVPQQVFDDGAKTYIQFPPNLGSMEAPPFFIVGSNGNADLVNYRVKGRFYEVDRLFNKGQLRLGEHGDQTVITITRTDPQPIGG